MTDRTPVVSVVTTSYNQREKLLLLAEDLGRQHYDTDRLELVVVDDGGTDGSTQALTELARTLPYAVRVLRRDREGDYLSARRWNDAIANARPETSVFVQVDDVRVRPDFVARHVAWHTCPKLHLVTGAKFEGDQMTWDLEACRRFRLAGPASQARDGQTWTAMWGASLSFSRRLVEAASGDVNDRPYDERMSGWGHQEVEFAYRCHLAGAHLVYDPAVGVYHQNHELVSEAGRGLDHAAAKLAGDATNVAYLLRKHGLNGLPRW